MEIKGSVYIGIGIFVLLISIIITTINKTLPPSKFSLFFALGTGFLIFGIYKATKNSKQKIHFCPRCRSRFDGQLCRVCGFHR